MRSRLAVLLGAPIYSSAAGVQADVHVEATDLGIAKEHQCNHAQEEIAERAGAVCEELNVEPCCGGCRE